jgi:hypothetical protein
VNAATTPRQVLLFSGHLVDAPGRVPPRFPSALVPAVRAAIEQQLDRLGAGRGDLALTQGAAGGDLLFAEACQKRGLTLQLLLPQNEADFVAASILSCEQGAAWLARWNAVRAQLARPPQALPAGTRRIYERCNHWLLEQALVHGAERLRFICLWDGEEGGAGGTGHMVAEVKRIGAPVAWIDIRQLHP